MRTPASSGARTDVGGGHAHTVRRLELRLLGRALERERRALAARDGLEHRVEVAGADLALVARRRVAVLLVRELRLLQPHVGAHSLGAIAAREIEHRVADRVEAGERHELELVAHRGQLALERRDRRVVEVLAPVEGGRAVVGEELARELRVHGLRELRGLVEIRSRRLAPEHVGVRRVRERTRDRRLDAGRDAEEALRGPLARDELAVALVDVARQQRRRQRIGARDEHGRHVENVRREPGGDERADELGGRHEHLPAEVSALLLRRELVLEVDAGRAGLDERLHELERVERPSEAGLRVGHDRREPVGAVLSFGRVDLVGAEKRARDALHERGRAVRRIQALVGVGLPGEVRVGRDLPARDVDRLQPRLDHLHGLRARHRAERGDVLVLVHELPETLRAEARERVLDPEAAADALHVVRPVRPFHADPAAVHLACAHLAPPTDCVQS